MFIFKNHLKRERRNFINFLYDTANNFSNNHKETFLILLGSTEIRMYQLADLAEKGKISESFKNNGVHVCSNKKLDNCISFTHYKNCKFILFASFLQDNGMMLFHYYSLCKINGISDVIPYPYYWNSDKNISVQPKIFETAETHYSFDELLSEFNNQMNKYATCEHFRAVESISTIFINQLKCGYELCFPFLLNMPSYYIENANFYQEPALPCRWKSYIDKYFHRIPGTSNFSTPIVYQFEPSRYLFGGLFIKLGIIENIQYNSKKEKIINLQPFAVIKSCTIKDLLTLFVLLYDNTNYKEYIISMLPAEIQKNCNFDLEAIGYQEELIHYVSLNSGLCNTIYEAIIRWATMFVWKDFCDETPSLTNAMLYNIRVDKSDNDKILEESLLQVFNDVSYKFIIDIYDPDSLEQFEKIEPQDTNNIKNFYSGVLKTSSDISTDVLIRTLMLETGKKSFTAEDLLYLFERNYYDKDYSQPFSKWYISWSQADFLKVEIAPDVKSQTIFANYIFI